MGFRRARWVAAACVVVLGSGVAYAVDHPASGPLSTLTGGKSADVKSIASLLDDPDLGDVVDASVIDASSGRVLLDRNSQALVVPASPLKLITATAALSVLGPSRRLTTRVLSTAPVVHGVINGDIYLVGAGDPTLSAGIDDNHYPRPAQLETLARAVRHTGAVHITGRLILDAGLFAGPTEAPGWRDSYFAEGSVTPVSALEVDEGRPASNPAHGARSLSPISDAGNAFATALLDAGVHTGRPTIEGDAPPSAHTIAQIQSPPVRELVDRMLQESDNDIAESLGRLVAIQLTMPGTFSSAATALRQTMTTLGLPLPAGAVLEDASGLSRDDRVSTAYLTSLLRFVSQPAHPNLRETIAGLPVAGATGTLANRFRNGASDGGGLVRAKTGSLSGVSSLVGTATTAGGRLVIFAVCAQDVISRGKAEAALDRFAAGLTDLS